MGTHWGCCRHRTRGATNAEQRHENKHAQYTAPAEAWSGLTDCGSEEQLVQQQRRHRAGSFVPLVGGRQCRHRHNTEASLRKHHCHESPSKTPKVLFSAFLHLCHVQITTPASDHASPLPVPEDLSTRPRAPRPRPKPSGVCPGLPARSVASPEYGSTPLEVVDIIRKNIVLVRKVKRAD